MWGRGAELRSAPLDKKSGEVCRLIPKLIDIRPKSSEENGHVDSRGTSVPRNLLKPENRGRVYLHLKTVTESAFP